MKRAGMSKAATDPCKIGEKGSIPFRSTQLRKGNPMGDGIRLLAGRASRWCLEGSTPSPSALQNGSMVKRKSSPASNRKFRVRILVGLLQPFAILPTWLDLERRCSCKADHAGANPVVGSENDMARGCAGQHDSLRNCRTRFDSWTGYLPRRC